MLTNANQHTQSYEFTNRIAAFLSVVLITEMLEICIQTSYDQNVQLILKSYLPVVYGTPLSNILYLGTTSIRLLNYFEFPVYLTLSLSDEDYSINVLCALN